MSPLYFGETVSLEHSTPFTRMSLSRGTLCFTLIRSCLTSLSLGEHWRLPLHPLYIIRTQRNDSRLTHKYPSSLSNTTQLFAQCHLFLTNYSHSLNLARHCCTTLFKYIPLVAFLRTNKPKTEIRGLSVRNKSSQLILWCYILFNVPYQDRRELALFTGDHLHRYRLRWLEWIF